MLITWTATCPQCHTDCTWQQRVDAGAFNYRPEDLTVMCPCDKPHAT